ncbi:YceD family protein [Parerythrobacter aestuarii]|uniref:YceD family protein n=1 Tax=Parerythrobacter aestuarii TaxID=3020909 RepID=UPI0024DE0A0B|nr:DUF177 domain-containing protein [Parerythrobacter aestuarii]
MSAPELSRIIKLKAIKHDPVIVEADETERAALAKRFGISAIGSLRAEVSLDPDGERVSAGGTLTAEIVQACAISGEDFPVHVEEPLDIVFVPAEAAPVSDEEEEIEFELDDEELDEIEYDGDSFDLGEAVAQTLALAIDPYAEGPNAEAARTKAGLSNDDEPSGPLADALKALKR